jgi:hypothetical protein
VEGAKILHKKKRKKWMLEAGYMISRRAPSLQTYMDRCCNCTSTGLVDEGYSRYSRDYVYVKFMRR